MLDLIHLPFCDVLMHEAWDAPPGRVFTACRARHGFRGLLGNGVVEEYATISAPIFLAPNSILGKIYNAGISLGHKRDAEMGLDQGWPPLCIGLYKDAPALPVDWEATLLNAIMTRGNAMPLPAGIKQSKQTTGGYALERWRFGSEVTVIATTAPLLPAQLGRLCDADSAPLTVAVGLGTRIARQESMPQTVNAVSEKVLAALIGAASAA